VRSYPVRVTLRGTLRDSSGRHEVRLRVDVVCDSV